jgi:hypothetical protein
MLGPYGSVRQRLDCDLTFPTLHCFFNLTLPGRQKAPMPRGFNPR